MMRKSKEEIERMREIADRVKKTRLIVQRAEWMKQFKRTQKGDDGKEIAHPDLDKAIDAGRLMMEAMMLAIEKIPDDLFAKNPNPEDVANCLEKILQKRRK